MILNIYKPKGLSSFGAVARVRKSLNKRKVGHAGTLDPLAQGVLVVLTDEDTKKQNEIMEGTKEYEAQITFGVISPTMDLEFVPKFIKQIGIEEIRSRLPEILKRYIGEIDQEVPMYSAKKVDGQPLYKQARKNPVDGQNSGVFKKVKIEAIEVVEVYEHDIKTDDGLKRLPCVKLKVICSHGTFIRSIAHDLGEDFGCSGILTNLIRTRVGDFKVEDSVSLDKLSSYV